MTQTIVDGEEEATTNGQESCGSDGASLMGLPKDETVKVTATKVGGVIQWELTTRLKKKDPKDNEDKLVFNKDDDGMKKKDYYVIRFDLDDHTGDKLEFAPNPMVAFWVNMGSPFNPDPECPRVATFNHEVFAVAVEPKKLTVLNYDDNKAQFRFSLGFLLGGEDPRDPASYVRFDPIGSNQDGGAR